MSLAQLFLIAAASMVVLALSRLVRVHLGRAPHPEGKAMFPFVLAFLVLPPIALGALIQPAGTSSQAWVTRVPLYAIIVAGLGILMWIAAQVVRLVTTGRSRQLLVLALVGSDDDPEGVPLDPPVTAKLAESVQFVDRTNAKFPRGTDFPAQIDREGFRVDWDALDAATATLEDRMAADYRLGLGVASAAAATARDARSRLDTLRRLAVGHGQAWVR